MRENATQHAAQPRRGLYPPIDPYQIHQLDVSGGHSLYVEECGSRTGEPVIVLHGGPGGGCSPAMRRFFDPAHYRIILFDQRGCGKSRPQASVENNTTWDLVADIETIRKTMGVAQWTVFGGSWGATLGLLYAQAHPEKVRALVLRGVFTMTKAELDWFYGGGAAAFAPERWNDFVAMIPIDERDDMIAAYHKRLFCDDLDIQTQFARAWVAWESSVAALEPGPGAGRSGGNEYARAFARLENHYFINGGFLEDDGQIMRNLGRLDRIPGYIVQGRYDLICPPQSAWRLHMAWPGSKMKMVQTAGHALSEPGIATELVAIMDRLRA